MSGPKCSQVELDAQRAKAQREKLERERKEREEAERARLAALKRKADTKIAALANTLEAADAKFLDHWTGNAFAALTKDLAALKKTADKNPEQADADADKLTQRLQALRPQADAAYGRDQTRKEVVGTLRTLLTASGYSFSANLSDRANPLSDVVIQAQHSSSKQVGLQMDLEMKNVRMNLDDDRLTRSRNGADCAKDLETLITALAKNGIKMKRTDTGVKPAGPIFPAPIERKKAKHKTDENEA